ncbi:MAG TPA: hypothetical protein VER96_20365 [Polyangiaceae bacterium]|nr:hypothetical protein [Polyangiaceae bacterium]
MRFRLFKPGQTCRLLALGLGSLAWFGLGAGCSGKPFTAGGSGGSSNGSGGTAAGIGGESAGEAGASGSEEGGNGGLSNGGNGGVKPNGGAGGKASVACDCKAGEYCQDNRKCTSCTDFSRLKFGEPQRLTLLAESNGTIERFARPTGSGSALFYASGKPDVSKLMYAALPLSGGGVEVSPTNQVDSGPLFSNAFTSFSPDGQNLFFDRVQAGGRKLHMAVWSAPTTLTKVVLAPEPINTPNSQDYSIAVSPDTGHVYWMSTRNGTPEPELLWQPTKMSAPPEPAVLDLKIKTGTSQCARSGEDATPWVNLAGTVLLFRNPSLSDNCEPNDSGATDMFAAPLNSDGTPKAAATALEDLNLLGGPQETDPTFSADACTIYFASDRDHAGDFDLYKAARN